MRDSIRELIVQNDICVLATASDNVPHTSLMAYLPSDDAREIYLLTSRSTRKYANCLRNPSVSLLLDTRETHRADQRAAAKALTLYGECAPSASAESRETLKARFAARFPHLAGLAAHPDSEVLVVRLRAAQLLSGVQDSHYETFAADKAAGQED